MSRNGALASAEREDGGGGEKWLNTGKNCVPTLHAYMKRPRTQPKKMSFFFFLSDSLGLHFPPLPQAVVSKETKLAGSAEAGPLPPSPAASPQCMSSPRELAYP